MNPTLGFVLAWLAGWLLTCFAVGCLSTYTGKKLGGNEVGPVCLLLLLLWPLFWLMAVGCFVVASGVNWSKPTPKPEPEPDPKTETAAKPGPTGVS